MVYKPSGKILHTLSTLIKLLISLLILSATPGYWKYKLIILNTVVCQNWTPCISTEGWICHSKWRSSSESEQEVCGCSDKKKCFNTLNNFYHGGDIGLWIRSELTRPHAIGLSTYILLQENWCSEVSVHKADIWGMQ